MKGDRSGKHLRQAQIELTDKPNDKDPHRKKQQRAMSGERWEQKRVCPTCGYKLKKFAIQCPECRTSLIPRARESKADMARRYVK